ncbi:translation initiation factor SUI1, partial [Mrakia frigida]|uniref:translation initiation factor eIF1 n=1 Tax=Mrakia frigida TaxID=29902 RepID=UPI003FCC081A
VGIQQRNGRKMLTTLQGLPKEFDPKKILKAFKKEFACNGTVVEDDESGQVIQLQGDQRTKIRQFLVDSEL